MIPTTSTSSPCRSIRNCLACLNLYAFTGSVNGNVVTRVGGEEHVASISTAAPVKKGIDTHKWGFILTNIVSLF